MKICIIGDTHLRATLPYASSVIDGRQKEWDSVKKQIIKTAQTCDVVVFLGDIFNVKHPQSFVINQLVAWFKQFKDIPLYIIAGNHDRLGEKTSIDFLQSIDYPEWHICTEPSEVTLTVGGESLQVSFLPYMTPGVLGVENLEEANKEVMKILKKHPASILFHHHTVSGTEISGTTSEHLNEIVLPREKLEELYSWVIGGHIHQAQWLSEKTLVTGSIFTQEIGEHSKSVWILDTDKGEIEEVSLPVRGIYKLQVDEATLPDWEEIPSNSIVKCIVTSKDAPMDALKEGLESFDAHILIEQYPNERAKVSLEGREGLDLSIDGLLKVYSDEKEVPYDILKSAMELLEQS